MDTGIRGLLVYIQGMVNLIACLFVVAIIILLFVWHNQKR